MIRILYVISDRNVGGAGIQLCNILKHLDRARFTCGVALPFGSELRGRLRELSVELFELEHPCDRLSTASVKELWGIIRKWRPQVVHANAALSARLAGKLKGCKLVHTRHCYYPLEEPRPCWKTTVAHWGNRWLTDRAIATAPKAAENLRALGIPRRSLQVILNGSDPVRTVSEEELVAWKARNGIEREDVVIGICARLEACKGHETFLNAAAMLAEELPYLPLLFLIVGEGSRRSFLEDFAAKLGIADRVRFTGFVSDMAPAYRSMRIHVNCSCGTETSCLAISEGMSAALPTVASDYGGNPMMVRGAGLCFPVGNSAALAQILEEILTDPALERQMGEDSLDCYQRRFTAERMTRETEEVYLSVLSPKRVTW